MATCASRRPATSARRTCGGCSRTAVDGRAHRGGRAVRDRPVRARFAADLEELGGMGAANVLWIRMPARGHRAVPAGRRDRLGAQRPAPRSDDRRADVRVPRHGLADRPRGGRDAATGADLRLGATLRRCRGHGPAPRTAVGGRRAEAGWLVQSGARRRRPGTAAGGRDLAGAAAGLELVDVIHRESAPLGRRRRAPPAQAVGRGSPARRGRSRARCVWAPRAGTSPTRSWRTPSIGPSARCCATAASRPA